MYIYIYSLYVYIYMFLLRIQPYTVIHKRYISYMYIHKFICILCITCILHIHIPVVPQKAAAEVSKIGNLSERLVAVNHGWQSESPDGPKGG